MNKQTTPTSSSNVFATTNSYHDFETLTGRLTVSHKLPTPNPIYSFFKSFTRFLTNPMLPTIEYEEFPELNSRTPISDYYNRIRLACSGARANGLAPSEAMGRFVIHEITVYVASTSRLINHEYFIAKVTGPYQSGCTPHVTILLEFHRTIPDPVANSNMQAPPSMVYSSTSMKDSFSRNAVHQVRRILEYPSGDRLGATVKLSGEGITLPDLTVLALCAHEQASTYNIISRNCYWFVYAMIDGLRRLHQGVEIDGEFSWDKIPAWFKKEWKGEQLITGYNKGKSDLQDSIDELIHHKLYQELKRKYEELQHEKDNTIRELQWQLSQRHNDACSSFC